MSTGWNIQLVDFGFIWRRRRGTGRTV